MDCSYGFVWYDWPNRFHSLFSNPWTYDAWIFVKQTQKWDGIGVFGMCHNSQATEKKIYCTRSDCKQTPNAKPGEIAWRMLQLFSCPVYEHRQAASVSIHHFPLQYYPYVRIIIQPSSTNLNHHQPSSTMTSSQLAINYPWIDHQLLSVADDH